MPEAELIAVDLSDVLPIGLLFWASSKPGRVSLLNDIITLPIPWLYRP